MSQVVAEQIKNVKKIIEELQICQSDYSPPNTLTRHYGFIKFDDNEIDENFRPAQYIRLALKTDAKTVVKFMKDAWRLPTPDLIISITGGAKYSDLSARLKKAFQIGLVSAATTTNAWIITAGTNAGVVKEVGEALNTYRYKNQINGINIPCIGIASWGYTAGKEQLERSFSKLEDFDTKSNLSHMAIDAIHFNGENVHAIRNYIVKNKEDKRCDLERNHTHFLLFDDGTTRADNILPLRADIEMYSRRIQSFDTIEETTETLIPIVMVLVDGGDSSIETLCEALDANTPVVVVKRSGRAADLVADIHECFAKQTVIYPTYHSLYVTNRTTRRPTFVEMSLHASEIHRIFSKAKINNPWVDKIQDNLCRIIHERHQLVTVFDFDSDKHHGKLEEAILEAVFNAAKFCNEYHADYQTTAELRLALAWHNVDYARRFIFTERTISKWQETDIRQGLVDTFRRGYIDFLELFLEYGITTDILTIKDLEYLYTTASIDDVLPLKDPFVSKPSLDDFYDDYLKNYHEEIPDKNLPLSLHAIRDLYFWALFFYRLDFSMFLCSKTWNPLTALLFGAKIYRKAAELTVDSETKNQYEEHANTFDRHAEAVIDRIYNNDRDLAIKIILQPAAEFFNVKPLELALQADCRSFLASKCVQKHLDNEWFGNINYKRQNINLRVFFCCLFFPLIPIFLPILPYIHRHQPFNPNATVQSKKSGKTSAKYVSLADKIVYFYRAPIVRFYYNLIFFFIFLGLFSYVLLVDYYPINIAEKHPRFLLPISEIWLHLCIWGIIIEETRQIFQMHSAMEYFNEVSNMIDSTAIVLYLIGFGTRFIASEEFFTISKIALGLDLILWYIRILHLFAAYEKLGPKLIMIFNTMKDLVFFVCFILIFLLGFSITSWSLILTSSQLTWHYNEQGQLINVTIVANETNRISWQLLRDVTNYGVWKVFGQVDIVDANNSYSAVTFILAILFVAISNVLLLNVLVALFNVTITNVQRQSHDIWRYQRFLLVNEFRNKSLLPPPFNALYCVCNGIVHFIKQYRTKFHCHQSISIESISIGLNDCNYAPLKITDMMRRENAIAEDFWRDLLK